MIQSESLKKNRILVSLAESNKNNLSWQFFSFVSFKFLMPWVHTAASFLSLPSTGPPSRCSPLHCLETRGSSENHLIAQSSKMCLTSHQSTWLHFPLLFFSQFLGFSLGLQALHTVGFSLLSLFPVLTILPLSPPHPNTHTLSRVVHSRSECDHVTPLNAIVIGRPSLTAGQEREGMLPAWMLLGQGESRLPQAPRGGREGPLFAVPVWSLVHREGWGGILAGVKDSLTPPGLEGEGCIGPAPGGGHPGLHGASVPTASGTEVLLPIQSPCLPPERRSAPSQWREAGRPGSLFNFSWWGRAWDTSFWVLFCFLCCLAGEGCLLSKSFLSCKVALFLVLWPERAGFAWAFFWSPSVNVPGFPTFPAATLAYMKHKKN